jgi:CO/xanthine dehydrogenase FAD-binding subunit
VHVPDLELHEAATLEEAAAVLARYGAEARLLAGGTDLLVDLKTGRVRVAQLVSINRIDALRSVSEADGNLCIGALTTITELDRSPIVRERFAPLLDATRRMAAPQIRNVATVGGNIACAVPCADLPPILTAMNASVVLWSSAGATGSLSARADFDLKNTGGQATSGTHGQERLVPLESFFVGPRQTIRRDDEVLTEVLVPRPPPGSGAAYARFQLRDGNAIAVAAVAAAVTLDANDLVRNARIVLGAVAPGPKLVESAGAQLVGQRVDEDAFRSAAEAAMQAAEPISDVRGSAHFRRELVGVLARRALSTALDRAKEPQ